MIERNPQSELNRQFGSLDPQGDMLMRLGTRLGYQGPESLLKKVLIDPNIIAEIVRTSSDPASRIDIIHEEIDKMATDLYTFFTEFLPGGAQFARGIIQQQKVATLSPETRRNLSNEVGRLRDRVANKMRVLATNTGAYVNLVQGCAAGAELVKSEEADVAAFRIAGPAALIYTMIKVETTQNNPPMTIQDVKDFIAGEDRSQNLKDALYNSVQQSDRTKIEAILKHSEGRRPFNIFGVAVAHALAFLGSSN